MKRTLIAYCLGMGILFGALSAPAEVVDKIMAILDEELILLSEVRETAERPVNKIIANLENSTNVDEDALHYVIEQRLLQREIQYLAFPKDVELVMSLVMKYINSTYHDGSMQSLEQQFQEKGIEKAALEQELVLYMKGIDYIRRKFRFSETIDDPEEVLKLFQAWIKDLHAHAEIHTLY